MAYPNMGSLAVATLLTLVFRPALYLTWFGGRRPNTAESQSVDLAHSPPPPSATDPKRVT